MGFLEAEEKVTTRKTIHHRDTEDIEKRKQSKNVDRMTGFNEVARSDRKSEHASDDEESPEGANRHGARPSLTLTCCTP